VERPVIISVQEAIEGNDARISVVLDFSDEKITGSAVGPADPASRPRLVGEATLDAVERATHNAVQLDLAAVATQELGPIRIALAQVDVITLHETLVGSALIREDDAALATVRAVLDAINRRLVHDDLI
jgi:hypothetical protein